MRQREVLLSKAKPAHVAIVSYGRDHIMDTAPNLYRDLNSAINWCRFNLKLIGAWPEPNDSTMKKTLLSQYGFLVPAFIIFFCFSIPRTIELVLVWGDLDLVIDNLSTGNISMAIALLKLLVLCYNREGTKLNPPIGRLKNLNNSTRSTLHLNFEALRQLVGDINDDWLRLKSEEDYRTMLRTAKTAKIMGVCCCSVMYTMATIFLSLQIFTILQERVDVNGSEPIRPLIYTSYFPYDTQVTPNFELTCLVQIAVAVCTAISYSGVDTFFSMLIMHLCGQFRNLNAAVKRMVSKVARQDGSRFRNELTCIVQRHEHLNRSATVIEDCVNLMLLGQLLGITLHFCLQGFQVYRALNDGKDGDVPIFELVFLAFYVAMVLLHFYVYCYVGEMLSTESTGLGLAVYESSWYNLPPKEAKDLMFIMYRTKIPLKITAGKFSSFSIVIFSEVLQKSAAYLSVLLTVKNSI